MAHGTIRVGIVGVSGYSGMELARLLAGHPCFELVLASSDKWAGRRLGEKIPLRAPAADLICVGQKEGAARLSELALVFLCTPAEASIQLAPVALDAGARVVDLSGGFRLAAADYPRWYGFEHAAPGLVAEAVYSMPEATGGGDRLRAARLVANPGCYPTVSSLLVLPLLRANLIEPRPLIIDAKSGTTGAGRKGSEEMSFSEVAEDLRAYRVLRHQHTPEIERALSLAGVAGAQVTFTPHLVPVRRGILATAYAWLRPGLPSDPAELDQLVSRALTSFVEARPFLRTAAPEEVTLHAAVGTNRVVLGARADAERGLVVGLAAMDNLVKGAAGQAVQNANLMFDLAETAGLEGLAGHTP